MVPHIDDDRRRSGTPPSRFGSAAAKTFRKNSQSKRHRHDHARGPRRKFSAQNLYRELGYTVIQRINNYYNNGEDCYLMMKALA